MPARPRRLLLLLLLAAPAVAPGRALAQASGQGASAPPRSDAAVPARHAAPARHEAPAHPAARTEARTPAHEASAPRAGPAQKAGTAPHRVAPAPGPVRHAPHPAPHPAAHAPAAAAVAAAPPAAPAAPVAPTLGSNTNLPLPRFAALRSDDVNLRVGPGTRYPIQWVYKRRDLPVEIEREFDVWRLVRDSDGVQGWVNQATLGVRRTVVVVGAERVLRGSGSDTAAAVAQLKPGVIGRLRGCAAGSDWCDVQVGDYRGFLRRDAIWGLLPGEAVQ